MGHFLWYMIYEKYQNLFSILKNHCCFLLNVKLNLGPIYV